MDTGLRVRLRIFYVFVSVIMMSGCFNQDFNNSKVITVSITPWAGYYPLYYAIESGIDERLGVELRVFETLTLDDFSRANIKDHVDAFSLTAMELVRANSLIEEPIHFAVFMDYSNGADVIVAQKHISSLEQLHGKTIGYEYATLGHLFLELALRESGIDVRNYNSVHVDQLQAAQRLMEQSLDAFVTFPPVSTDLLQNQNLHIIYDSSRIPYQIVDFLMVKDSSVSKLPQLQKVWHLTLAYIEEHPGKYQDFLASLLNVPPEEVAREVAGLELLNKSEQKRVKPADVYRLMNMSCDLYKDDVPDCIQRLNKLVLNGKSINFSG